MVSSLRQSTSRTAPRQIKGGGSKTVPGGGYNLRKRKTVPIPVYAKRTYRKRRARTNKRAKYQRAFAIEDQVVMQRALLDEKLSSWCNVHKTKAVPNKTDVALYTAGLGITLNKLKKRIKEIRASNTKAGKGFSKGAGIKKQKRKAKAKKATKSRHIRKPKFQIANKKTATLNLNGVNLGDRLFALHRIEYGWHTVQRNTVGEVVDIQEPHRVPMNIRDPLARVPGVVPQRQLKVKWEGIEDVLLVECDTAIRFLAPGATTIDNPVVALPDSPFTSAMKKEKKKRRTLPGLEGVVVRPATAPKIKVEDVFTFKPTPLDPFAKIKPKSIPTVDLTGQSPPQLMSPKGRRALA